MSDASMPGEEGSKRPFALLLFLLLLASIAINYIDRGALSIAAPSMQAELHLSPVALGWLLSAFFWTYALAQPLSGRLIDRYGTKYVFAFAFLIWSVATAAVGAAHSYVVLIFLRLLLGLGESVAYPAYSKILVEDFSRDWRGLLNALIDACSRLGPAASTMLGASLIGRFGWRALFFTVGSMGLLWLVPWILFSPNRGARVDSRVGALPFRDLLRVREVWVTSLGMFCFGYGWFFLVSWLPVYLVTERHLSLKQLAVSGSAPFWLMAVTAIMCGWLSDRICRRSTASVIIRRNFVVTGFLSGGALLVCTALAKGANLSVLMLVLACGGVGVASSNLWALTQTLARMEMLGSWTGMQNAVGNIGGAISPLVTGLLVEKTGSFVAPMLISAGVFLLGGLIYLFGIREFRPPWRRVATV